LAAAPSLAAPATNGIEWPLGVWCRTKSRCDSGRAIRRELLAALESLRPV
jgi:hypothetical protein